MSCSSFGDEAQNFMSVWEVEAAGRTKIMEAKERRMKRIEEAKYLALVEIEQFREEKEAEFQEICDSMKESIQEKAEKARELAKRELEYMEERVKLCKPLVLELLVTLATNPKYSVHRNVDTRRWIQGLDKRTQMPPDRRMCDKATWELVQRYASNCEKLASQINIGKRKKHH
ncbi:vacuolar (H+)-ATPase G subunit [Cooperia oncophora]